MEYGKVVSGTFVSRPNRFVAEVQIGKKGDEGASTDPERIVRVHVKNTGRCRELLLPGARVWLSEHDNPARKTRYSLITVEKEGFGLVNLDSQAPNQVVYESLQAGHPPLPEGKRQIRREFTWGNSRLDLAVFGAGAGDAAGGRGKTRGDCEAAAGGRTGGDGKWKECAGSRPLLIEVKGVTLERDGRALFPDAPTERGVKHIRELIRARKEGYDAWIFFVLQLKGVSAFLPNDETHPAFGAALRDARDAGVRIVAFDCVVTPNTITLDAPVGLQI